MNEWHGSGKDEYDLLDNRHPLAKWRKAGNGRKAKERVQTKQNDAECRE